MVNQPGADADGTPHSILPMQYVQESALLKPNVQPYDTSAVVEGVEMPPLKVTYQGCPPGQWRVVLGDA